ncbi:MAG: anaerobic ribonucleoside-triphosphate reductase, partial [Desulfosalsimonas sp.]
GGLFGANPLTGSIGVVTVNLPRLGYLAENKEDFYNSLAEKTDIAARSLAIKRKVLEKFTEQSLYPYSRFYLGAIKEQTGSYWTNHFSTIGIIGMNEACINLLGRDIGTPEGQDFARETLDYMRNLIEQKQQETGEHFNLEATPGEGTAYRLALLDKNSYPELICANEREYQNGSDPFYTNSSQLPVNYTDDLFEALELQDDLQTKYTGGTVFHIFLGEQIHHYESAKNLVRKVTENFRMPYFTISPTFSVCTNHGYLSGYYEKCPKCGEPSEVYSRVVGYLRPVHQWNNGKQREFELRQTFHVAS